MFSDHLQQQLKKDPERTTLNEIDLLFFESVVDSSHFQIHASSSALNDWWIWIVKVDHLSIFKDYEESCEDLIELIFLENFHLFSFPNQNLLHKLKKYKQFKIKVSSVVIIIAVAPN